MRWFLWLIILFPAMAFGASPVTVAASTYKTVRSSGFGGWADFRPATTGTSTNDAIMYVGGYTSSGTTEIFRGYSVYNLSSSGLSGATLDSMYLVWNWSSDNSNTDFNVEIYKATCGTSIDTDDFDAIQGWQSGTAAYTGTITHTAFNTSTFAGADKNIKLNAGAVAYVDSNKTGYVYFVVLNSNDRSGSDWGAASTQYVSFESPDIKIWYTAPAASGPTTGRAIGTILHNPDPIVRPNLGKLLNEVFRNP